MKKEILSIVCILILALMLLTLTGCGNSTNNSTGNSNNGDAEVTKVGNLSLELQQINDFSEGLAAAKKDGKWGYIDKAGNVVIDFIYEKADNFSEGLASVKKDDKAGFINTKGETVVDFIYRSTYAFSNGYGVIREGIYYGAVDKEGNVVIEPTKYYNVSSLSEDLFMVDGDKGYDIINKSGEIIVDGTAGMGKLSDGLIPVKQLYVNGKTDMQNGKWGFLDKSGNIVIDYQYDYVGSFVNGLAGVVKDGKIGYINTKGEYVIEAQYPYEDNTILRDYSCGIVRVYDGEKSIYFDESGNQVFTLENSTIGDFSEDMTWVINDEDDKRGYVNTKGKIVIDYKYTRASSFSDGLAKVYTDDESFEFINSKGKTILAGKIVK